VCVLGMVRDSAARLGEVRGEWKCVVDGPMSSASKGGPMWNSASDAVASNKSKEGLLLNGPEAVKGPESSLAGSIVLRCGVWVEDVLLAFRARVAFAGESRSPCIALI
jgi:hypothetical protein